MARPKGHPDSDVIVERMLLGDVRHAQIRRVASGAGALVAKELEAEAHAVLDSPVFEEGEEDTRELTGVLAGDGITSRDTPNGSQG